MSTTDIKHLAVETIYLVPDASEGQRCYLWCDDPAPGLDMDPSEAVEYLRKDVHDAIIAKQANAAKQGIDAAKKGAGSELEQAKRLSAESSPAALESEREANARLTELVAQLEQERDALAVHVERLRNACQMAFQTPLDEHYSKGVNVALHHAIESTGENNLTRRDLIKQAEGLRLAADFIEQKAIDYDAEHGSTDPSTGHREYPGDGADYYNEMMELADDLRQQAEGHQ